MVCHGSALKRAINYTLSRISLVLYRMAHSFFSSAISTILLIHPLVLINMVLVWGYVTLHYTLPRTILSMPTNTTIYHRNQAMHGSMSLVVHHQSHTTKRPYPSTVHSHSIPPHGSDRCSRLHASHLQLRSSLRLLQNFHRFHNFSTIFTTSH